MAERLILDLPRVKDHLLIKHHADDSYLIDMMEAAQKRAEMYLERPFFGDIEMEEYFNGGRKIILSYFPLDKDSITVTDLRNNTVLENNEYQVEALSGFLYKVSQGSHRQVRFAKGVGRWQVNYTPGLEFHPYWHKYYEPALRASLRDLIADWYEERSPGIREERLGGGSVLAYLNADVSPRIKRVWDEIGRDIL